MNIKFALPQPRTSLLILAAFLLLTGCGRSVPISYYQLAPVRGEPLPVSLPADGDLLLGVGPVRLQEHLERPQLIRRTGTSRLQMAARHRWAEPLAANIAWVLRDNLATLLATEHLLLYPWDLATPVDYQVSLEILRCEGAADGSALLEARWTITDRSGKELLSPRRGSYRQTPPGPDEEGLAAALSEALASLSAEIAQQLAQMSTSSTR